jgi:creatinine amidohydrolase
MRPTWLVVATALLILGGIAGYTLGGSNSGPAQAGEPAEAEESEATVASPEKAEMKEVVEYQKLLPYQFDQRMKEFPLVYIPIGTLEWHGPHQALGLDALKMHALCVDAARKSGGIVFPPIYHGIRYMVPYGEGYEFDANFPVDPEVLKSFLAETLTRLEAVGFKAAILTTGHTCREQINLTNFVAGSYKGKMKVLGTNDAVFGRSVGHTSDHANKWETSILWYYMPELVEIDRLPEDPKAWLPGIGENPRTTSSRELGKKAADAVSTDLANRAKKLMQQAGWTGQ